MSENTNLKAVIYARYSSDNQREESIEGQLRECTAFAEKSGITILRHYIDRAFSAKTDNRPEFQNMIRDSGKHLFDMIIVWKLDRFARNRYDSARYKAQLKRNGVKVVSATEVISDGAEGIILESVLEGYAEYYSADLAEKVIRGMTENALKVKFNGGTIPIGYVIDNEQHFQLDPLTAPFVLDAYKKYDSGWTMKQIRDWLNENGITSTLGHEISYNTVQHLLNNRRYIGEYSFQDIVTPDAIPAIVPKDLFDRVQAKLSKNKKAPARHKAEEEYLLTTKLFCGYCGAYLFGESGTSHTGTIHRYYKCATVKKKRGDCHKKPVKKDWIEDLVIDETMKMVMDDKAIEAIVSMLMELQDRENVNLPLYEQQLKETDSAIQNMLNAIQQGILTKSTKERLEELERQQEELKVKIDCEKLAKPKISAEFMTFWLQRFRKLDISQPAHRKMLIDTFINAIFLYDDKLVITYNYKDGTDTISFSDLKAAETQGNTGSDLDCFGAPQKAAHRGGLLWSRRRVSSESLPQASGRLSVKREEVPLGYSTPAAGTIAGADCISSAPSFVGGSTLITLIEVNEDNWMAFAALRVREEQKGFLDSALGILARGYAYRACRARVFGVAEGEKAVGLALVKDLEEEPACYDLQQFMIDGRYQGRGCGTQALKLILAELARERKYPCAEVCVKRKNAAALHLFEKLGFTDTGYIDPDVPDAVNLMYHFN